jgi:hypothetical protein
MAALGEQRDGMRGILAMTEARTLSSAGVVAARRIDTVRKKNSPT